MNLSGKGCRQYEEYMCQKAGWHWQSFIKSLLELNAKPTRIDLALDIFDDSTPSVQKLQDYIKRGQLSSFSHKFREINSGRISDGVLTGFTIYIGSAPQVLRIYDKKQEVLDNTGTALDITKWVRWELELTDYKAVQACNHISEGKELSSVIKGILSSQYSFKTQPKGENIDFHNKTRWNNMRWWDSFIGNIDKIPLRSQKQKATLHTKKDWLEKFTAKSRARIYEVQKEVYGLNYADEYLKQEIIEGRKKFNKLDRTMITQSINELLGTEEI